jgi:hypothetical protein
MHACGCYAFVYGKNALKRDYLLTPHNMLWKDERAEEAVQGPRKPNRPQPAKFWYDDMGAAQEGEGPEESSPYTRASFILYHSFRERRKRNMSAEKIDYAHVLADMEARRTALDAAIASMRAFLSGQLGDAAMATSTTSPSVPGNGEVPAGAFLGKSIPEAAKLYLQIVKRKATSRDIAEALRRGGMESTSGN